VSRSPILAPSPNADERPDGTIDMIVLHYTGMRSGAEALARLRDPAAKVSAHYLVEEDGSLYRLVPDGLRAWHAGVSFWQGRERLNDVSIGIEIVNPGHEFGYRAFPAAQMAVVTSLVDELAGRYAIAPDRLVAHSDIAPERKEDPGELFDWTLLAAHGLGIWPRHVVAAAADPARAAGLLQAIGYRRCSSDEAFEVTLRAFQRHWRPRLVTGRLDAETMGCLEAVATIVRRHAAERLRSRPDALT
jgi:N-acetylmuramoyl-L-alanine amidase